MAGHRYPGSSYLPLQVLVQYSYPTTVDPLTDREMRPVAHEQPRSRDTHNILPQIQPHVTDGQTYLVQGHQDIPARQDIQVYAPSTVWAHQGSDLQQHDDAQDRVTLPGDHPLFEDPHRRTTNFVDSGQCPGTRYASYADDAEQCGVTSAARAITHFEKQFSHGANPNTSAQDVQQGNTPWPYPQRIDPNYRDYPLAVEYTSRNGKSSRTRR
ncbi:hypothetical protein FPOAC1_009396 [Fusarium poae]|uniref:hypothetical protein n=1 Tax=Fusarium poae TaxID=36050 RepID=UPI001CE8887B|nr:hypothetical protein FPOAC1_009396 [Fusarium poae]KAG8669993.1 hypothetical protein FPOAC1_009396 [Fusarium poae]